MRVVAGWPIGSAAQHTLSERERSLPSIRLSLSHSVVLERVVFVTPTGPQVLWVREKERERERERERESRKSNLAISQLTGRIRERERERFKKHTNAVKTFWNFI